MPRLLRFTIIGVGAATTVALVVLMTRAPVRVPEARSSLTVAHRGTLDVVDVFVLRRDGRGRRLGSVGAGSSARFEMRGLEDGFYFARLIRADGVVGRIMLRDVSEGRGIEDSLIVTDSSLIRRQRLVGADTTDVVRWMGPHEPTPQP